MTKLNKYEIEKDKYLECWIVWEIHPNYKVDVHQDKTKEACKKWLNKKNKKINKKG